jgi:hypothetical protein
MNLVKATSTETDDEIMERMRERFEILEDMTKACKSGKVRALIVSGAPGVGKSFGVEKVLSNYDMFANIAQDQSLKKYEVVKGAITELGLYAKLYEFRNDKHILVFDDCDTIFGSELSLNILKAALDTSAKRMIHWNADSYKLKEEGIPNKFEFCGSVIFITNVDFNHIRSKKLKSHLDALSSRCHFIDLTVHTLREKLLRIRQIVGDGMLDNHKLSDETKADVVDYVTSNTTQLNELSLRTVIKTADLASAFPDKWKKIARVTLMK